MLSKYDFCVIGAGSGGLSFAAGAAQMGASVALLEHQKMGGDCLNYGCVPSKALLSASKIPGITPEQVHNYIHDTIAAIAPHDSVERFTGLGVKVISERGQFVSSNTVATDTLIIEAKRVIIATGSRSTMPPIPGLDTVHSYTNETIFTLKEFPKHLLIIGGGPIGMEIANAYLRLNCKVTILEAGLGLAKDDPELSLLLKQHLIQQGLTLKEQVVIEAIHEDNNGITCSYKDHNQSHTITASHLLVATGRRPNIEDLNLESANIKATPKGIIVDASLRTSNPRVYAIGDCIADGYKFTHAAGYHAGLVIRHSIFGLRTAVNLTTIPWVTYTSPELAHVGAQESDLKAQGTNYQVLRLPLSQNDRAQAERHTDGLIKVLASPKGHILGVSILAPHAGEMIYPWVMAMQNKLKLSAIATSIAPYPTYADASKRIAGQFYGAKLFSPWMQMVVKFLMWLRR